MTTVALLKRRLGLVYRWYGGMVNADSGMLEYLYLPESDTFVRERSPIRDIASVWDLELLGESLDQTGLIPVIERSLAHYAEYLVRRNGQAVLDAARLREPSSIAHSAFMILVLLHAPPPRRGQEIAALAEGILHQQRPDGSYKVFFEDLPDSGEELYAGEAMLALLDAYRQLGDVRHLKSTERAFSHYESEYFGRDRVAEDLLVFFANWQSQACRLLFDCTHSSVLRREIAAYVFCMHDRIIDRGFFKGVQRDPAGQDSVEVACALEGINDAYSVARAIGDGHAERYRRCLCSGVEYLLALQCTNGRNTREHGGFGLTRDTRAQRIDVTGHAASAFMKCVANGIECPPGPP